MTRSLVTTTHVTGTTTAHTSRDDAPVSPVPAPWLHCGGGRQRIQFSTTPIGRVERLAPAAILPFTPGLSPAAKQRLGEASRAREGTPIPAAAQLPALLQLITLLGGIERPSLPPEAAADGDWLFDDPAPDEATRYARSALVLLRDLLQARDALPPAPTFITLDATAGDFTESPLRELVAWRRTQTPSAIATIIARGVVAMTHATPPLVCWYRAPSVSGLRAGISIELRRLDTPETP